MEYEVTFNLSWRSYVVEADNEKEAEEQAKIDLFDDIKHNPSDLIEDVSIRRLED